MAYLRVPVLGCLRGQHIHNLLCVHIVKEAVSGQQDDVAWLHRGLVHLRHTQHRRAQNSTAWHFTSTAQHRTARSYIDQRQADSVRVYREVSCTVAKGRGCPNKSADEAGAYPVAKPEA